jgi:hypothetical protein
MWEGWVRARVTCRRSKSSERSIGSQRYSKAIRSSLNSASMTAQCNSSNVIGLRRFLVGICVHRQYLYNKCFTMLSNSIVSTFWNNICFNSTFWNTGWPYYNRACWKYFLKFKLNFSLLYKRQTRTQKNSKHKHVIWMIVLKWFSQNLPFKKFRE